MVLVADDEPLLMINLDLTFDNSILVVYRHNCDGSQRRARARNVDWALCHREIEGDGLFSAVLLRARPASICEDICKHGLFEKKMGRGLLGDDVPSSGDESDA